MLPLYSKSSTGFASELFQTGSRESRFLLSRAR
jgi:hypothetical protein